MVDGIGGGVKNVIISSEKIPAADVIYITIAVIVYSIDWVIRV